jgi:hypothetical protein
VEKTDAARFDLWNKCRYVVPAVLFVMLTGSFAITALHAGRLKAFWTRTSMIEAAVTDPGSPVYATRWFIRRYRSVLDKKTLSALKPLQDEDEFPDKYWIVADHYDWEQSGWENVDWSYSISEVQPFDRTALRRIVDAFRDRKVEFYEKWYVPHFYRTGVDRTRPPTGHGSLPPWERTLANGANR